MLTAPSLEVSAQMAPMVQALFPHPKRLAALADAAACANSVAVNLLRVINDDLVPRVALPAGVLTERDMEPVRFEAGTARQRKRTMRQPPEALAVAV
jgi:hypothetical protein